jgi:hypothetical protein
MAVEGIYMFSNASTLAVGPKEPRVQWLLEALILRVKRPGRESDHSCLVTLNLQDVNK